MAQKKWMQSAVHPSRRGEFTAKAKRAGMTVGQYANKVLKEGSRASTKTKRQASFAKAVRSVAHRRGR